MVINQATLIDIYKTFSLLFKDGLESAKPLWDQIAMEAPSTGANNNYKWLGKLPRMRQWEGDRVIQALTAFGYTVVNLNFEDTIVVDRNDIEDDQLGVYSPVVPELGMEAMNHRDYLLWQLVLGAAFAGTNYCYDGTLFFNAAHPNAQNRPAGIAATQSNLLASLGKLTPANFNVAYAQLAQITDEMGRPLGITPNKLFYGPASREQALLITKAELIQQTTNINRGVVEPVMVPWFGNSTAWIIADTTRRVKPFIMQIRRQPEFVALQSPNDESVFERREFKFGVDDRKNVGFGLWQFAVGSPGTN
jgi:phage major head subunit gpT-like protein